jgi:hypothetical protein
MKYTFRFAETPDRFNELANHPRIRPKVAPPSAGTIDLSEGWGNCLGFLWPEGGFLLHKLDDAGLWEIHTLFERGVLAHERSLEMLHCMLVRMGADKLTTRVPASNYKALALARAGGMRDEFVVRQVWDGETGKEDITVLELRPDQWIPGNSKLEAVGEEVHEALEAAGHHVEHAHDPVHDAFVGFMAECVRAGVPHRGLYYYNRWAVACGYTPIQLIDAHTAAFDDVRVKVLPVGYEVTVCQSEP